MGKTRLMAEIGGRRAGRARGGIWVVDVAPLSDPGDVPYAALSATGIRDGLLAGSGGGDPGQAAERSASSGPDPSGRLVSGLRGRSGLIVLDNCEHLIDAVAKLADVVLSGCPGIKVLAASREAFGITGETVCPVAPLPVPAESGGGELVAVAAAASVRLLADRARAVRPGFALTEANAADVARICRVLDGMPLAIELAAARLRTMSPAQLSGRLGDRFAVLTGGSRTALPRHQTPRAVVEWSWDLLSKPERVLARRLAALPAGATLGAAEGICADEPDAPGGELPTGAVLDALTGLAGKSFLIVDGGEADDSEPRYRMLDTIRAYCLERLAETEEEEDGVRHRMCGYYLALAETAEPLLRTRAQRRWLDLLGAESGNMHAALRWAIERRDAGTALRFGAALGWYWYLRGQRADSASLARAALALDATGQQRADRATAEACAICAMTVATAGWDLEPTREALDAAAAAAAADPSRRPPHPIVVLSQAQVVRFAGDGERALQLLAGYVDSADPWTGAVARLMGADIMYSLGRIEDASRDCDAALAVFRDIGEIWGANWALVIRAELDKLTGNYHGAIAALEEAVALDRQLASASEATTELEAGDTARGTTLLRDALGTAATVGYRPAAAVTVEGLAAAALRLDTAERAATLLGAADSIRGAVDHSSLDVAGIRAAATGQLGEAAFEAAYRRGRGMPYTEALGFAQASAALA